ncbi:hypothetical protein JNUCC0626_37990 [Lentzea sp. JNUCC 0626]|uniref:hypothetical protein n=1 Tax=Lentzea sp. JNUCC 0626 TaxID=3367513 RepID=UPI003748CC38
MKVADLLELAGFAGASVWLKMDGERATHRWTVIVSCAEHDLRHRRDVNRFDQVVKIVRDELSALPGEWAWLDDEIEDLDEFAQHYEELGRQGAIIVVDSTGEQPLRAPSQSA